MSWSERKLIEEAERIVNRKSSKRAFLYSIKQTVTHDGWKLSGRVARRMFVEDLVSGRLVYDVCVSVPGGTQMLCEVDEAWLTPWNKTDG